MKTMHHFLHPSKPIHSPPTPPSLHSNLNHTLDSWIDFSDCSHESDPITLHDLNPFNKPSSPSNHALNSIQSHDWVHQTPDLSQPLHQNLQFKPLNTILASSPTSSISNSSTLTSSLDSHPILNLSPTSQPLSTLSNHQDEALQLDQILSCAEIGLIDDFWSQISSVDPFSGQDHSSSSPHPNSNPSSDQVHSLLDPSILLDLPIISLNPLKILDPHLQSLASHQELSNPHQSLIPPNSKRPHPDSQTLEPESLSPSTTTPPPRSSSVLSHGSTQAQAKESRRRTNRSSRTSLASETSLPPTSQLPSIEDHPRLVDQVERYAAQSPNGRSSSDQSTDDPSPPSHQPRVRRQDFLERNRVAASKSRAKKKEWQTSLESRARVLGEENLRLRLKLEKMGSELDRLKAIIHDHHGSDDPLQNLMKDEAH